MLIISQTFVYISGSLNASAKIEFSLFSPYCVPCILSILWEHCSYFRGSFNLKQVDSRLRDQSLSINCKRW